MSQLLLATKVNPEDVNVAPWMVVVLGVATVFIVLVCIIGICKLLSAIMKKADRKQAVVPAPAPQTVAPAQTIPNKGEFVAAVSAVIAEELGTDISAIRIHDIKKV